MKRQLSMPLGVVWLATVVAAWLVTLPLLVLLIGVTGHHRTAGALVGMAALTATFACVVVGGPVTAVALRVRRYHRRRRALLSGLATGAVVLLFFYSYLAAAGAPVPGAWKALPPLVIVTAGELALAFGLCRYCRDLDPPEAPPPKTPRISPRPEPDRRSGPPRPAPTAGQCAAIDLGASRSPLP